MHGLATHDGPSRAVRTALTELDAELRFRHPVLRAPLTIVWNETLTLALDGGVPWVFGPAERDPLRGRRGTSVLPRRARTRLRRIAASGVPFQRLAIAHELDPAGPVRARLAELAAGPRTCTEEDARPLVGTVPSHPAVARAVRLLEHAVGRTTAPAQVVHRCLDPIVFGVSAPEPLRAGDLALWYPLVAWRW